MGQERGRRSSSRDWSDPGAARERRTQVFPSCRSSLRLSRGPGREQGTKRQLRGPEADQQLFEPREQLRWFAEKGPAPDAVCWLHLHSHQTGIAPMELLQRCTPVRGPTGGSNQVEAARRPCCLPLREVAQAGKKTVPSSGLALAPTVQLSALPGVRRHRHLTTCPTRLQAPQLGTATATL